jgi:DHA2 family multidrug resistance protein
MTMPAIAVPGAEPVRSRSAGAILVTGVCLAALTEAIAGTVLSLGRSDIIGDTYATPDEFAWLDVLYTALKFSGFLAAAWAMDRVGPRTLMISATLIMGAACALTAFAVRLDLMIALRALQGASGGVLLVAGQTILFMSYPRSHQPLVQAMFAIAAVVAAATVAPALQGWIIDRQSWTWVFLGVAPVALAATAFLVLADFPTPVERNGRSFDVPGFLLISATLVCFTYVLSQGPRWNWLEAPHIGWLSLIGSLSFVAFLMRQMKAKGQGLIEGSLFRSEDFTFALIVSFVAGAALFGSAFLILAFAVSVLGFTPTEAGRLLLPSSTVFVAALLVAAALMQLRRVPPIATVPAGILAIMIAMWLLSHASGESGAGDMMPALLLRGLGLGCLFLSITLIAFNSLPDRALATGIGLFNAGRQLGGLIGVAGLQSLIDHNVASNVVALGANIAGSIPSVGDRLTTTTALLISKGMDAAAAGKAAASFLGRAVVGQSTVIAFDTAFNAIALLFVAAAPVVIAVKVALARLAERRESRRSLQLATHIASERDT